MPEGSKPGHEPAELLGQLARELSTLVRRDVEVAAAERLPILRAAFLDLAAVCVVAVAALFGLAALSVAGGLLAASVLPGWAAAGVVAAVWALIALAAAAVLLRPRTRQDAREVVGLLQVLAHDRHLEELRSSREQARDEAETEMRDTSGALVRTLLEEAAEHQLKALPAVAKREVGRAESDAVELLAETLSVLTAPARAGWKTLERIVEPADRASRSRPEADKHGRDRET